MSEIPPNRRRRLPFWLGITVIALVLFALPALYLGSSSRVQAELSRLRAEGILVDIEDLAPKVPPGERNAADLYQQAFSALSLTQADEALISGLSSTAPRFPAWDPARQAAVRRVLAANARVFPLAEQAAALEPCAFPINWSDPMHASFADLSNLSKLGRLYALRARVLAADGKVDEAVASLVTPLRMARHLSRQPTFLAWFNAARIIQSSFEQALPEILASGDPSPATCRMLFDEISASDFTGRWRPLLQGELAWGVIVYDQVRSGALPLNTFLSPRGSKPGKALNQRRVLATCYPNVGRPLLDTDELTFLRQRERLIRAAGQSWSQYAREFDLIQAQSEQLPEYRALICRLVSLSPSAYKSWLTKPPTQLGNAQVALALRAYKAQHGRYPADLAALEQDGWKLPRDIFTGKPYHYHPVGNGFLIYSLGEDGKDDGGRPMTSHVNSKAPPYDIPLRCDR
jgi:hypothetical protein